MALRLEPDSSNSKQKLNYPILSLPQGNSSNLSKLTLERMECDECRMDHKTNLIFFTYLCFIRDKIKTYTFLPNVILFDLANSRLTSLDTFECDSKKTPTRKRENVI